MNLERAIEIAVTAHRGQVDKSGAPYILHPLRVMLGVKTDGERIVAVLHDVVEDCEEWPLDRLRGEGLPERLTTALESVTRNDGETYTEFIERSKSNAIGRRVKAADLRDNMDLSRIENPTEQDHKRTEKYRSALVRLGEGP
jgi:(p)ppGpp synthase/HD superfamily hydrolase